MPASALWALGALGTVGVRLQQEPDANLFCQLSDESLDTHFQGVRYTQVSFGIFMQEAWISQLDFKWNWLFSCRK